MHSLKIPEEYVIPFIEKGHQRVEVQATFEGRSIKFHAALKKYRGQYQIMFGKRNQQELGIFPNDYFSIQLFEDQSKYGVEVPEELSAVLESDIEALEIFESLTPGKIRSLIYTIARFKNSQTRIDKSLTMADNLKMGIRDARELFKAVWLTFNYS